MPEESGTSPGSPTAVSPRRSGRSSRSTRRSAPSPTYERATAPHLHPGKAAQTAEGWLGELHPTLLDGVWGAFELDLDALAAATPQAATFEEVSPYPEVRQDLAFVIADDVPAADVVAAIREAAGELLRSVEVFDEYRNPETIGEGKRSLAFRLAFGSPEGTLTDEDVAPVRASIVDALATRFDAVLRALASPGKACGSGAPSGRTIAAPTTAPTAVPICFARSVVLPTSSFKESTAFVSSRRSSAISRRRSDSVAIAQRLPRESSFLDRLLRHRLRALLQHPIADEGEDCGDQHERRRTR